MSWSGCRSTAVFSAPKSMGGIGHNLTCSLMSPVERMLAGFSLLASPNLVAVPVRRGTWGT